MKAVWLGKWYIINRIYNENVLLYGVGLANISWLDID